MYNIDSDIRNADWLKTRSWDLPAEKEEFLATIGGPEAIPHFLTLPAAEAMPAELRNALRTKSKN